jgi:hypothetical protein
MKAGTSVSCLLVFAASVFVGYHLTALSFAWVDLPNFGLPQGTSTDAPGTTPTHRAINLESLKSQFTPEMIEKAKRITTEQALCMRASWCPKMPSP